MFCWHIEFLTDQCVDAIFFLNNFTFRKKKSLSTHLTKICNTWYNHLSSSFSTFHFFFKSLYLDSFCSFFKNDTMTRILGNISNDDGWEWLTQYSISTNSLPKLFIIARTSTFGEDTQYLKYSYPSITSGRSREFSCYLIFKLLQSFGFDVVSDKLARKSSCYFQR